MSTKLDRLNELLKSNELDLPDFRRHIDASFRNLQWLQKALKSNPNPELRELLQLPQHKLLATS